MATSLDLLSNVISRATQYKFSAPTRAPRAGTGDTNVDKLQAELAELQRKNLDLKSRLLPDLSGRTSIRELFVRADVLIGTHVSVAGWVRHVREGGGGSFLFLILYDGTFSSDLQVIVDKSVPGFQYANSSVGTSLFVRGTLVASKGREQKIELVGDGVELLGSCDGATYPLSGKNLSLEYLRSVAHLRPRTTVLGAVARVRNKLAFATHKYFQDRGYQYVHTPIITASDCEGAGEMFQVTTLIKHDQYPKTKEGKPDWSLDFFKKPAFLTVSGQLNGETYATALSSIYTFGPTFRAEVSLTTRHLSEFWMIEPEIAFADLSENMRIAEGYIKFVIGMALHDCEGDLAILEDFEQRRIKERLEEEAKEKKEKGGGKESKEEKANEGGDKKKKGDKPKQDPADPKAQPKPKEWRALPLRQRLHSIVNSQFARVTYTNAIDILRKVVEKGHVFEESAIEWGMDLGSEHERYLCEVHFQRPTIVTNYPKEIKAFYMRLDEDEKTVSAMDVLVPGVGELVGGSQREERLDVLLRRMKECNLDPEAYGWYLDLRRYGSVPHAGFGVGFERLVCYTTGLDNIRDSIPFPRFPYHATF